MCAWDLHQARYDFYFTATSDFCRYMHGNYVGWRTAGVAAGGGLELGWHLLDVIFGAVSNDIWDVYSQLMYIFRW